MQVRPIEAAEITTYAEEGVVLLPRFADAATVAALRDAAERRAATPSNHCDELAESGRFLSDQFLFEDMPEFRRFVFESGIAESAACAMQIKRVRLYFDHLFLCAPQTPTDYYWHQDISYWPVETEAICSIWLCLTDCTVASSALQFVRGREHQQTLYAQVPFGNEDLDMQTRFAASDRPKPPAFHEHPERYEILSWDYRAGDAVLFNARIMHSSSGNQSRDVTRIAYSTRWIGDDARFVIKPGWQDPLLFPHSDEPQATGQPLRSRKFPLVWSGEN